MDENELAGVEEAFDNFRAAWEDLKGFLATPVNTGSYRGAGMVLVSLMDYIMDELETHLPCED